MVPLLIDTLRSSPYRRWLRLALALLACLLAWLLWSLLKPTPNRKIVMSVGSLNGAYQTIARQYAHVLARQGITLELRTSSGAVENYLRLKDPASEVDVALIQSGVGDARDAPNLQAVAAVSYEPLWLFYRHGTTLDRIAQLAGQRIGVGVPGSGLRKLTLNMLSAHAVTPANATLVELTGQQASDELRAGKIDAAFFVGGPESPLIATLLNSDLRLMNFSQADAIARKFPALAKIVFPRGAINLEQDLPPQDVTLLSATSLLVVKDRLHSSLVYALLDGAFEVHGSASAFSARGDFPNRRIDDFPLSDEAARYFKSGRPFLQSYLPFWLANFIEQRFVILVPLLAMLFALLQAVPRLIGYRLRQRLARWYGAIKQLEDEIRAMPRPVASQVQYWQKKLEYIDANVHRLQVPQQHFNQLYGLKLSINLLRDRLQQLLKNVPAD